MENRLPPPSAKGLWAIVDCNNFFASCETLFRPDLKGRPLVVLSSNDGCVIARSAEAKSLGIKMGVPAFQLRGLFEANNVEVFSSNFRLYSEVSRRVMEPHRPRPALRWYPCVHRPCPHPHSRKACKPHSKEAEMRHLFPCQG